MGRFRVFFIVFYLEFIGISIKMFFIFCFVWIVLLVWVMFSSFSFLNRINIKGMIFIIVSFFLDFYKVGKFFDFLRVGGEWEVRVYTFLLFFLGSKRLGDLLLIILDKLILNCIIIILVVNFLVFYLFRSFWLLLLIV